MFLRAHHLRVAVLLVTAAAGLAATSPVLTFAQAPAATRATPQRGTVKAIDGSTLSLTTDTGQQVTVTVSATARIQKLAPGSTDLKTAETAALSDISIDDRVLVVGAAGDTPAAFTATRVILMKSGDIAQKHEAEQQDWQKRGTGGIVSAVDATTGAITVSARARKLQITTSPSTTFRRYAGGSVKFEDAKPGTLAQIQAGDQLLARGAKSEDGGTVKAEEVVSGSFKNLSGAILSIDTANNTVSLKDLVTKKNVTVQLTPSSALHKLPADEAAKVAARAKAAAPSGTPAAGGASAKPASHPEGPAGAAYSGASDLSQIVAKLPPILLADLHTGDAVMIVAEQTSTGSSSLTAVSLLAGVEPILAAAPGLTLSPWGIGGDSADSGSSQ